MLSLNFLKLVRLSNVLFLRWLLIPCQFSVQSNGKKRLILDLRHVNFFVKKSKIKFEDAKSFLQCLLARPTAWACSFDIKSGYHHIEIFVSAQEFLGFSWVFEGVTKYFKFTVLPFGLSVGPYIFSKVMRPLVRYWRSKALSIVVYLDDGISAAQSFSKCEEQSLLVVSGLISLNLGLFPTSVSVNGSLFRSFAGWVFFWISKTIVCLYLPKRFLNFFLRIVRSFVMQ